MVVIVDGLRTSWFFFFIFLTLYRVFFNYLSTFISWLIEGKSYLPVFPNGKQYDWLVIMVVGGVDTCVPTAPVGSCPSSLWSATGIRDIMHNSYSSFGHVKICPRKNMVSYWSVDGLKIDQYLPYWYADNFLRYKIKNNNPVFDSWFCHHSELVHPVNISCDLCGMDFTGHQTNLKVATTRYI